MNQSSNKEHKSWKRKIEGNKRLATVTNPLRNYIEKEIKTINVKEFPSRP